VGNYLGTITWNCRKFAKTRKGESSKKGFVLRSVGRRERGIENDHKDNQASAMWLKGKGGTSRPKSVQRGKSITLGRREEV